jgi:hypothetical protein
VKTKEDGSYEILASKPGTYSLRVASPQHAASATDVVLTQEDRIRKQDITLERGIVVPLEIVSAAGTPLPGAAILEGVQPDRVNPQFMSAADERGRYELRGRAGESRVLYVVPRDGSFAVVRVQVPRTNTEARAQQVVVLPGSSALRVRTTDAGGKPVPASVLLRWNGEFIPGAILRFVTKDSSGTRESGEAVLPRLPAGAYEVWALGAREEEAALIAAGGTSRTPVRVGLSGGEQAVTLTVPERDPRSRR